MSDSISPFVEPRVVLGVLMVVGSALLLAGRIGRRLAISKRHAAAIVVATGSIPVVTLLSRHLGTPGVDGALAWLLRGWSDVGHAATTDAAFLLNVVLFVPAAALLTTALRRPSVIAAAGTGLALLIEITQAATGLGAPDSVDLAANAVGASIGAGIGYALSSARAADFLGAHHRLVRALAVIGTACLLGVVAGALLRADHKSDALLAELEDTFGTMTFDDARQLVDSGDGLTALQALTTVRADLIVYADDSSFTVRYPIEFFGIDRCVFVEFSPAATDFEQATGSHCTDFRGD